MDEEKKAALFLLFGNQISHKPFSPLDVNLRKEKPTPHKSAALW
jgi:hypothetical protein